MNIPNSRTIAPNPGSPEAIAQGCKCPEIDNARGVGYAAFAGVPIFVVNETCPLHAADFNGWTFLTDRDPGDEQP